MVRVPWQSAEHLPLLRLIQESTFAIKPRLWIFFMEWVHLAARLIQLPIPARLQMPPRFILMGRSAMPEMSLSPTGLIRFGWMRGLLDLMIKSNGEQELQLQQGIILLGETQMVLT